MKSRPKSSIEQGTIEFLYRPRVGTHESGDLGDVQRLILLLSPDEAPFQRTIAVGRTRLTTSTRGERFWGFVDLVLTPFDMSAALGAQVYGTKTSGLRHLPAAVAFADGTYEIELHGERAHLRWHVDRIERANPPVAGLEIERHANYILNVANPDPKAWGLEEPPDLQGELFDELETHVTIPSPFPSPLQERFGFRRSLPLDSPRWLDHPGAELIFVGAGETMLLSNERRIPSQARPRPPAA